ncbi:hypothetical protein L1286_14355 [Pseudoalteromonas sp. SMS1]|uniref:hypothetical protein n=1 Tax=Pseudoalteromonas sp. SMS1 TaxID=2908894 RepID=UPI001F44C2C9|nr:hypothetical protein [Pseudoalteromonas sp. SMS1]MCF2858665.1 hypothetical protein [Pseudoalteromonas sp. SMS1]
MKLICMLLCVSSSTLMAGEQIDYSDRVVIPEVRTVSVSSYTRTQFDSTITQAKGDEHVGKMYSLLTPDEQIRYKYNRGILTNTVTFEQYFSTQIQRNKQSEQIVHYMFWGK